MSTLGYILAACGLAAFLWFIVLPWVPPLYARYRNFIQRKANGQ